jgi:hypothetical protein
VNLRRLDADTVVVAFDETVDAADVDERAGGVWRRARRG